MFVETVLISLTNQWVSNVLLSLAHTMLGLYNFPNVDTHDSLKFGKVILSH